MSLTFITIDDITDNILNPLDKHIEYANSYLTDKAYSFNLVIDEIRFPPSNRVKRLGALLACRECALDMVGSDTTVMTDGKRTEDIYLQKYKLYDELIQDLESKLGFEDFATDDVAPQGKAGVGIINLSRA